MSEKLSRPQRRESGDYFVDKIINIRLVTERKKNIGENLDTRRSLCGEVGVVSEPEFGPGGRVKELSLVVQCWVNLKSE